MNPINHLYFRTKENGASVFRVDTENRQKRMDLVLIASLNLKKATIKPRADTAPSPAEIAEIMLWIKNRQAMMVTRQTDNVHRMMDNMNETAQWIQTRANSDELDAIADDLLLAMHDLRSAIVRRKTDFLLKK